MITLRRAEDRGKADFGWLNSRHTFSFGEYYDKDHMGFSALRVINDDQVAPAAGFPTHGHRDMEILSYVLKGSIAHKDSENNAEVLPPGEFQLMSAGSGIRHSEYNASNSEPLHFLQIWIQPNVYGQSPRYQQKAFGQETGLTLVVSPTGEAGSLVVKQDAYVYQLLLGANENTELTSGRNVYVHLITGKLEVEGETLSAGDGAMLQSLSKIQFTSLSEPISALVFDLP